MKFPMLSLGARFEFEGKIYTKAGPLTARGEDGGQRMIPRFAVLRPLDGAAMEAPPPIRRKLDEAKVMVALEVFHGICVGLLQSVADDPAQVEIRLAELDTARQHLIAGLE